MALTDPVPSDSLDVLKRNAEDLDKALNSASSFTNRVGDSLISVPSALSQVSSATAQGLIDIQADVDAVDSTKTSSLSSMSAATQEVNNSKFYNQQQMTEKLNDVINAKFYNLGEMTEKLNDVIDAKFYNLNQMTQRLNDVTSEKFRNIAEMEEKTDDVESAGGLALSKISSVESAADNAINNEIPAQIARLGLNYPPIEYVAGLTITSHQQTYEYGGSVYVFGGSLSTTTSGDFDEGNWQLVQNFSDLYTTRRYVSELESLNPTLDYTVSVSLEREGANFILEPDGYLAEEGDITFNNGRVARLVDIKNLKAYGAEGDASGVHAIFQGAVDRLAALGGGTLYIPNGRYGLESPLVIPKDANISLIGERVSKSSSLSENVDEAGVEIYAVNTMDELIEWNGEASVDTSANELGRGLYIRHIHLNGNNKATHLIDCLNIDLLDINTCRLTGSQNIIRSTFNGVYTSALLAGGLRVYNCTFGATGGVQVELDGQTQCWFAENWFAGTGSTVDFVINRSNKINIINNEFNNATDAVFRLADGVDNEATQDIIINDNKIALANATVDVIDDQRQLVTSKRVSFVGNTVVNGAGINPHAMHNPKSNAFAYTQTSSSKSYTEKSECNESIVTDESGLAKLTKYQTDSIPRFNAGVNSDAESGSNEGSNYVIQRFDDAGDLLGTEFFIDRETGRVYYKNVSATGNGATVDGTTGQIATDSLTTAAGSSVTITFNNPRVNFTPVICQLRSYSGTGEPIISKVTTGAGTFSVTIRNIGSSALNGVVNFMFHAL